MSKYVVMATWDDVPHLSEADKAELLAAFPEHQRDARSKGIPQLGSGAIFPVPEESIKCDPIQIPGYWAQIGGMDFGWDHPFAAVRVAWDRDSDTIYVCNAYRRAQATPLIHSEAVKGWGTRLPWAWPHDGRQRAEGKGDGNNDALAQLYRRHGLNLLPIHAQHQDGSLSVEAGIQIMLEYMQTGRFKVFRHLSEWLDEYRIYHRRDGRIVKEGEDLISATRYAVMMLRYAKPAHQPMRAVASPIPICDSVAGF